MKSQFNHKNALKVSGAVMALFLAGCSVHVVEPIPRPNIQPPDSFSIQRDEATSSKQQRLWWHSFDRPALSQLIEQSLLNNQNMAQAVAVLRQAQAVTSQTGSQRLPQLNLRGNASKDWEGSDAQRGASDIGGALSWELDIWDRIGASAQADQLEAMARAEDVEAVKLALSAEVANAYFGSVAAYQRIALLQEQLKLDRDLQNLLQLRLDNGVGTNVDVLQQKARVADSETLIPLAEADRAVYENRLDVLLGAMPDGRNRVPTTENLAFADQMPVIGVPAALLLNRPDLRAARAELVAADADIAAAIADRLPRVTLQGAYAFSDAASYTGPVAMIMGGFVQPLLDWGQRKAEVERNKALYQERLAGYTQLFLEAVEAVENALIREIKQREFLERLRAQNTILQATVDASEDRYTQGIDDYLPVINALQELRVVERSLIAEQLNLLEIRINLFRVIGAPLTLAPDKGQ